MSETTPQPPIPVKAPLNKLTAGQAFLARLGLDNFLLALLGVIVLAYYFPDWGKQGSKLPLDYLATYGVSVIFFFYGLRLSPDKLKTGLTNWRLHLVVQLTTFVLFPVLVLLGQYIFKNPANELLWLGTFYLAALPSTVSSSVVMVSIAGGNMPAAIFNASISSLIGVFITPLWMGVFLENQADSDFNFWLVIGKLTVQVLLPVTLGILLHPRFGTFAEHHRRVLRTFDQTIILLIVFTSFCESFARQLFGNYHLTDLLLLCVYLSGLFFLVYGLVYFLSKLMSFDGANRVTALFCGSKKSLVHGTVMSKVLFPDANVVGLILLPLMLYHALQLVFASIIAQGMARRKAATKSVLSQS